MNKADKEEVVVALIAMIAMIGMFIMFLTGCGKTSFNGESYKYELDSTKVYIAKFEQDTLKYIMIDLGGEPPVADSFAYKYWVNERDSLIDIYLEHQPEWWNSNIWTVTKTDFGLQSVETGNKYYLVK